MVSWSRALFLASVVMVWLPACGNEKSGAKGTACVSDSDCGERGVVCDAKACKEMPCKSLSDCGKEPRLCIDLVTLAPPVDTGVCTAIECNEAGKPCGNGGMCSQSFLCVGGAPPLTGDTSIPEGCTKPEDCNPGELCNPSTKACYMPEGPKPGGDCSTCDADADCQDGRLCQKIGAAKACLKPCTTNGDCGSGWTCFGSGDATAKKTCVPGLFQCTGCLTIGCKGAGEACSAETGTCLVPPSPVLCASCTTDGSCGPGARCYSKGGLKACVPECGSGCPAGTACSSGEVKMCEWAGEKCGDTTPVDPCANCSGLTPKCVSQKCVECASDADCSDKKKCKANACTTETTGGECTQPGLKYWNEAKNKCCACQNSTHCGGNPCDGCACQTETSDVCAQCKGLYPGCAEFQGSWVCVQCTEDSHCKTGKCNVASFTCTGENGDPVQPPATGNCQTEGCYNATDVCDQKSGLCIGPDGNCDNVSQFCLNAAKCISQIDGLLACFGGGAFPTIPGAPGGGGAPSIPGNCECKPGVIPGFDQGDCPSGFTCGPDPFAAILALLGGGTCTPPNTCHSGN